METKVCNKCNIEKNTASEYYFDTTAKLSRSICKECDKSARRLRRKLNGDKERAYRIKYYYEHKKEERQKHTAYEKLRCQTDPNFKLRKSLRARLRRALKDNTKSGSAVKDLGCSIEELKKHLESKFKPGMTWENHGTWHLDHVRPLVSFNLTNREQFLQACHYTNLQPLWAEENLKKSDKYEETGIDTTSR